MTEFKFRSSGMAGTSVGLGVGLLMVVVGFFAMTVNGIAAVMLGSGVLMMAMHGSNMGRSVVTLHDDHLDMKVAPLASRKLIRYTEMSGVEVKGKVTNVLTTNGPVALPMAVLEPEDAESLVEELKKRIAGAA